MSNLAQFLGGQIKSIQRGQLYMPDGAGSPEGTVTITSVNTSKAVLHYLGTHTTSSSFGGADATIALTNSTTLTATRASTSGLIRVGWQVVEYY